LWISGRHAEKRSLERSWESAVLSHRRCNLCVPRGERLVNLGHTRVKCAKFADNLCGRRLSAEALSKRRPRRLLYSRINFLYRWCSCWRYNSALSDVEGSDALSADGTRLLHKIILRAQSRGSQIRHSRRHRQLVSHMRPHPVL
jgi:hypothetical protein